MQTDPDAPVAPRPRGAPRRRRVYPLKLWPDLPNRPDLTHTLQKLDGELHLVPPLAKRPFLAYCFLYDQATRPHEVPLPSVAQLRHLREIAAMAYTPPPPKPRPPPPPEYKTPSDWCALLERVMDDL